VTTKTCVPPTRNVIIPKTCGLCLLGRRHIGTGYQSIHTQKVAHTTDLAGVASKQTRLENNSTSAYVVSGRKGPCDKQATKRLHTLDVECYRGTCMWPMRLKRQSEHRIATQTNCTCVQKDGLGSRHAQRQSDSKRKRIKQSRDVLEGKQ
jgi:hypothetical protein